MIGLSGVVDILQRIDAGAASGQAVETVAMVLLRGAGLPDGYQRAGGRRRPRARLRRAVRDLDA